jgi:prevent-host-death family protein
MKAIGVFEVKNKLSEICETVARTSEPVLVTRRGEPLVQIQPISNPGEKSSVWSTVKESRKKYGPLKDEDDFELPPRPIAKNRPDPLGSS